jgi:hypothetical protein
VLAVEGVWVGSSNHCLKTSAMDASKMVTFDLADNLVEFVESVLAFGVLPAV